MNYYDKKFGLKVEFKVNCFKCNNKFFVLERENLFPIKKRYYCTLKCANSRNWTVNDNEKKSIAAKISEKIKIASKKRKIEIYGYCDYCTGPVKKRKNKFCSKKCRLIAFKDQYSILGRLSASKQSLFRRSKNEKYFFELCQKKFKFVKHNETIFNGWDADVIIEDWRIAVLWNGIWHHKKITEKHSILQVQNRDKIKINEIIKKGYYPYIINDFGKFNKFFVEKEFEKLLRWGGDLPK